MGFVLISRTRGDELIQSTEKVVAVSEYRGVLEKMRHERAIERAQWLAQNPQSTSMVGRMFDHRFRNYRRRLNENRI